MPDSQVSLNYNFIEMKFFNLNLSFISEDINKPGTLLIPGDYYFR
jgi:hypothetical protein